MKAVSVFLDGQLVHQYPMTSDGRLIGGPLTTDEEFAAAARACAVEDGVLSAAEAVRADYVVDGEPTDPSDLPPS